MKSIENKSKDPEKIRLSDFFIPIFGPLKYKFRNDDCENDQAFKDEKTIEKARSLMCFNLLYTIALMGGIAIYWAYR